MNPLSVHEAIKQSRERGPLFVEVDGLLSFEFEDLSLSHLPRAEQVGNYDDNIWIETEGVFRFNEELLTRWAGKRVLVFGELETECRLPTTMEGSWGFGHFGLFPAQIKARRIETWKDREKQRRFDEG